MGICGEGINSCKESKNRKDKSNEEHLNKENDNITNLIKGAKPIDISKSDNVNGKSNRCKKKPNNSTSNFKTINNDKPKSLDKKNKNKNENKIQEEKSKTENIKENSQKENNNDLNNMGEENNNKIFTNIDGTPILKDNNSNDDIPDDCKKSQKNIYNSCNMGKEDNQKIFSNNKTPILEKPDINIYNDVPNDNKKSQKIINNSIKNENNNFDIDKYYFFGCPQCLNIPYIEGIKCDFNTNDIFVTYICKCELKERENPINLCHLIIEKEPINKCQIHSSEDLVYYCKTCKMKICLDCYKEEHNNHEINNNYLMSEKNENNLVSLIDNFKENFKGYDIFLKIYDEYVKKKDINNIEKFIFNSNIMKQNDENSTKINNDKEENAPISLDEPLNNIKSVNISKNVTESLGFQTEVKMEQSINNQNINFKNSTLEEIIKKQNNNPKLSSSIKDNKSINNLSIKENQNGNDFNLFSEIENDSQIKALNDTNENPKNIPLYSIKEVNESKNISINDEENVANQKEEKLKHYYNTKTLKEHKDRVISLIQLESGNLVSGASDGLIIIWDIDKSKSIRNFYEIGQVLCLLEFEPNKLLTGTSENNIGLWDLDKSDDSSSFNFLKHSLWVNCLVKIDKDRFASASNDCNIYVWDYYKKEFLFELIGHTDSIITLIKLDDGRLCSGGADLTIKIWNLEKRECEKELTGHKFWIKCLYKLKNGILLSSDDKTFLIWKNFSLYKSIKCNCQYRNLCQIDDNCLACASYDNVIDLFDLNNFKKYEVLTGHYSNVICIIKLKNNKLASCSLDKTIKIWEPKP